MQPGAVPVPSRARAAAAVAVALAAEAVVSAAYESRASPTLTQVVPGKR